MDKKTREAVEGYREKMAISRPFILLTRLEAIAFGQSFVTFSDTEGRTVDIPTWVLKRFEETE